MSATLLSLMGAAPSFAEGGSSVANASAAISGQQEFGNLSNGGTEQDGCDDTQYREFWLLPVKAGDKVRLDWEIESYDPNADEFAGLLVLPVGTSDYNIQNQQVVVESYPNSTGKDEISFTATTSGDMVLDIKSSVYGCEGGTPYPYDFTAYITHAIVLGLPTKTKLRNGSVVNVAVHTPGGGAVAGPQPKVSLQIKLGGAWTTIGSASVSASRASVTAHIPAKDFGKRARLRALAKGGSYQRTASQAEAVVLKR